MVARRGGRDSNASSNNSSLNSSFDSLGDLPNPRVGSNPRGHDYNARNKRVRESYMEAVSNSQLNMNPMEVHPENEKWIALRGFGINIKTNPKTLTDMDGVQNTRQ